MFFLACLRCVNSTFMFGPMFYVLDVYVLIGQIRLGFRKTQQQ